ncbi:hypothetical protein DET56_10998 [Paenibacillus pabuli]|uniref:Uncharacterized protein n=1 Tax=Paenibacillus pabuli TaxID=1472 RepID=A0A855XTZ3_9BACL|nr:hypothetical protein DET56_10998 [Paenibacillus pabuli]PXW05356.1 hypothetical protein DEU73_10898 [Paenibacillus taichungensis]
MFPHFLLMPYHGPLPKFAMNRFRSPEPCHGEFILRAYFYIKKATPLPPITADSHDLNEIRIASPVKFCTRLSNRFCTCCTTVTTLLDYSENAATPACSTSVWLPSPQAGPPPWPPQASLPAHACAGTPSSKQPPQTAPRPSGCQAIPE